MISVAIPVGPKPSHRRWLGECIDSVRHQTMPTDDILLIDDMAGLKPLDGVRIWRAPWLLGVPGAFNAGVSLAHNQCVYMLGSDDWMEPQCLEECWRAYEANRRRDAYYYTGIRYTDGRADPVQTVPCNCAMVTKGLWRQTGGFPPETGTGACDAALISHLWGSDLLVPVADGRPLLNYRVHPETDTAGRAAWQGVILASRDILTRNWTEPQWGRYEP